MLLLASFFKFLLLYVRYRYLWYRTQVLVPTMIQNVSCINYIYCTDPDPSINKQNNLE
jgi:hypothetical protein